MTESCKMVVTYGTVNPSKTSLATHRSTLSSSRMKKLAILICIILVAIPAANAQGEKKKGPFAPIKDDPNLPRVLLIGDSISIGYTLDARKELEGVANIHRIPTNAGHTGMGIAGLPKWLAPEKGKWDVIHFNWGLWDLCYRNSDSKNQGRRDKVNGKITHSIDQYIANLEKIVAELKKTGATLIFATTTPVPENEVGRKVGDDLAYNKAAVGLMKKHGIAVNDLHAVMAGKMDTYGVRPGDVHFKAEGSALLGKEVAKAIGTHLTTSTTADSGTNGVLFDGTNFNHWDMQEEGGWIIDKDGSMTCVMKEVERKGKMKTVGRGYLWSKKSYSDFELTLGYKLSEGANSGVFYRTNIKNPVQDGFELQLMDNEGFQRTHGIKEDRKLNGSFYDCKAPSSNPQKPIGQWNDLTIRCEGPRIRFTINGIQVIDVDVNDWPEAGKNPDGTRNKFKTAIKDRPRTGLIGFQNHGQKVWFRDVSIKQL